MQNFYRRIEVFSNIAIITFAILATTVFASRYFLRSQEDRPPEAPQNVKIGTKILFPAIDWSLSDKNLLLAISTSCKYCHESLPFYKKILEEKNGRDIRVIVFAPQKIDDTRLYLSANGIAADEVIGAPLEEINVKATPTLLIVDSGGTVINSWVGKLLPTKENEVTNILFGENADPLALK